MLFGDPRTFAIEAVSEPDLTPPSAVWGRMCVRLPNANIGDFNAPFCALHPAYRHLSGIRDRVCWDELFTGWSDFEIFQNLYTALWFDDDRSAREVLRDAAQFRDFCFLDGQFGEPFDEYFSVIIRPAPGWVRILYKLRDDRIGSAACTEDAFQSAIDEFLSWFDAESDRLRLLE